MSFVRISDKKKSVVMVASVMMMLAAVVSIFRTMRDRHPQSAAVFTDVQVIVGEIAAQETTKLLGGKGKIALVVLDASRQKLTFAELQEESFLQTLKRLGSISVVGTEKVPFEAVMFGPVSGMPHQVYTELLAKYQNVDAIVSMIGAPVLSDAELAHLPEKRPKFVAVLALGFKGKLKTLFEEHVIQVAITPHDSAPPEMARPAKTKRDWFDRNYRVVTPETSGTLMD